MIVKIFWKESCPKCPKAKILGKRLQEKGFSVEFIDALQDLAQVDKYDVMATPSVFVVDDSGRAVKAWHGTSPKEQEIEGVLRQ